MKRIESMIHAGPNRNGRLRFNFLAVLGTVAKGGQCLFLASNVEATWRSWVEFVKDHIVEHVNDHAKHVTTFTGGGTVTVRDGRTAASPAAATSPAHPDESAKPGPR